MDWAIVEVMGHRKYAGRVSERSVAGVALLHVAIPSHTVESAQTEYRDPDGSPVASSSWEARDRAVQGYRPCVDEYPAFEVLLGGDPSDDGGTRA